MKLTCNAWRKMANNEIEIWFQRYGVWVQIYPALKSVYHAQEFLNS